MSGQSVAAALKCVSQSWDSGRVQLFDRLIAPELSKIVADGQPESQVTTADRQALARAWRGFASGLGSPVMAVTDRPVILTCVHILDLCHPQIESPFS